MEEHVYQIRKYLPIEFAEIETNEFVDYLLSAYIENAKTEKYQFSFTAFHMLYMSYIYKINWLLKEQGNQVIANSLNDYVNQNRGSVFNTLFDLSQIQEKTTLDKLLKALSFHMNDVDTCKNLVEVRNKCSHASGKIYYKRASQIENYIQEGLEIINSVQNKINPYLAEKLEIFINNNFRDIGWPDNSHKINEWRINSYLSEEDIKFMLEYKPSFARLASKTIDIVLKKIYYAIVVFELSHCIEESRNYFNRSLKYLMDRIDTSIEIVQEDTLSSKSIPELLEEVFIPMIVLQNNDDQVSEAMGILFNSDN